MSKTPEELSQEAAQRIAVASAAAATQAGDKPLAAVPPPANQGAKAPEATPAKAPAPLATPPVNTVQALSALTPESLEALIEKLLKEKAAERAAQEKASQELAGSGAPALAEPNYATLTEAEAMSPNCYIPVIQHEVPDYMNIKLADNEFACVWANRDQRRLGQLEAEGYELLRRDHLPKDYNAPLKFNSEGLYVYEDVVAMRVHKRILYGKRRRIMELSIRQLKPSKSILLNKRDSTQDVISDSPALSKAFSEGQMGFYEPNAS